MFDLKNKHLLQRKENHLMLAKEKVLDTKKGFDQSWIDYSP